MLNGCFFIKTILLVAALSCGKPQLMNLTKFPWNDFDSQTLTRATKRCGEIYKQAPCVKVFFKTGEQDYRVICGKENGEAGPTLFLTRDQLK